LLTSSAPNVVSIDSGGYLVAHQNGEALVRSNSGAVLRVTVHAANKLQLIPAELELISGGKAPVKVLADGREVDPSAYRWETTAPNTAVGSGSQVHAGLTAGGATLTVRLGNVVATLPVTVRPAQFALRVRATNSAVSVGAIERVSVDAPLGVPIEWTSSNTRILQALRDGVYYANARGVADACAVAGGQASCTRITVR
jgi:hypothetical protein